MQKKSSSSETALALCRYAASAYFRRSRMTFRLIPLLLALCLGCRTQQKTAQKIAIAEQNKDVIVLAHLINRYMLKTGNTKFTLADILKQDTSGRITKNFSKLEVGNWPNIWRGGYAVFFKFADGRNQDAVKLEQSEGIPHKVIEKEKIGRNEAQLGKGFDGEIRLNFPERFYRISKIIIKEKAD